MRWIWVKVWDFRSMRWMRWKNFWAVKFFSPHKRWKKFFSATSRMRWRKNSALPAECGEKNFHRNQQNAAKKNFAAKIANFTNTHRANFNAYLIFTGNIIKVRDRCRSGLRSWWHAGGGGSHHCTAVSFL